MKDLLRERIEIALKAGDWQIAQTGAAILKDLEAADASVVARHAMAHIANIGIIIHQSR